MMLSTKETFIRLSLKDRVLQFGEFKLKSGRISPYFFNAGLFYRGESLHQLGECYADVLLEHDLPCQHLFGPAYKGLPLATATAIALAKRGYPVTVSFNRKEAKNHGEGGSLIGAPLQGKTVVIDDVITAGTAFREAQTMIQSGGGQLCGLLVALDRCEKGLGETSAIQDIQAQGIEVRAIITVFDLIDYLEENKQNKEREQLLRYQKKYGSSPRD